jgi:murein DD-endopeptidase MepM/ murein hydrolase activator NlpD
MQSPKNARKTSPYGYRSDPFTRSGCFHNGIDFAAPYDTPVYAVADGVVVESRASGGYGWLVTIYHGEYNGKSVFSQYAHAYPHQIKVVVGQQVYGGKTIIQLMGSNGRSTGVHVHVIVRYGTGNNPPTDNPENWFG